MKTLRFVLPLLLLGVVGCGSPTSPNEVRNPCPLDGIANKPNSWHKGHVTVYLLGNNFFLDDGTQVKFYFTGGTNPELSLGQRGTLYVSVPSYDDDDADNTYYFQKFTPDKENQ